MFVMFIIYFSLIQLPKKKVKLISEHALCKGRENSSLNVGLQCRFPKLLFFSAWPGKWLVGGGGALNCMKSELYIIKFRLIIHIQIFYVQALKK